MGSLLQAVGRMTDADSFVRGMSIFISNYGLLNDEDAVVISWCDQENELAGEMFASAYAEGLFPAGLSRPLESTSAGYFANHGSSILQATQITELSRFKNSDFDRYRDAGVMSVIGVPVVWRGRTIGVIQLLRRVTSESKHSVFIEQMSVLLAPHLVLARSAAMEKTVRSRYTDLIKLADHSNTNASASNLFSGIGQYLRRHVGFDAMAIRIRKGERSPIGPTYRQGVIDFPLLENTNESVIPSLLPMALGRNRAFVIGSGVPNEHLKLDSALVRLLDQVPSILVAPIWHSGEFIGTIECYSLNEHAYGVAEIDKIEQLTQLAGNGLLQTKFTSELNDHIHVREVLTEISRISITETDIGLVLSGICQQLSKILLFDHVTFYLPDSLVATLDGLHKESDGFTFSSIPNSKISDLTLDEIESVTSSLAFEKSPVFTVLEVMSELEDSGGAYVALSSRAKLDIRDQRYFKEAVRHIAPVINYLLSDNRNTQLSAEKKRARLAESDIQHFKEIDKLQKGILSTVTHELRSPLTSIIAFADILGGNHGENLTAGQLANIDAIRRSSQTVSNIISDLDQLTVLEPSGIDLLYEETDLASVIKNIESDIRPILEPTGHKLRLTMANRTVLASVDRVRLAQVLTNLINNAAKYSPPGSIIRLLLRFYAGNAHFFVKDEGEGIPIEEQQGLFQLFTRAASHLSGPVVGNGIGLYVCEKIVHAHGGRIDLHSKTGAGTTIHFWIPVVPSR